MFDKKIIKFIVVLYLIFSSNLNRRLFKRHKLLRARTLLFSCLVTTCLNKISISIHTRLPHPPFLAYCSLPFIFIIIHLKDTETKTHEKGEVEEEHSGNWRIIIIRKMNTIWNDQTFENIYISLQFVSLLVNRRTKRTISSSRLDNGRQKTTWTWSKKEWLCVQHFHTFFFLSYGCDLSFVSSHGFHGTCCRIN